MSDPIIETTSRSWLSRVFGAFGRIVIGVILVIAAIAAAMPALEPGADPLSLLPPPPGAEAAV